MLFVGYLFVASFNNFSFNKLNIPTNHAQLAVNANVDEDGTSSSALIFEKNEKDNEYTVNEVSCVLHFFIEFLNFQTPLVSNGSARTLAEIPAKPIYISVRNFRI